MNQNLKGFDSLSISVDTENDTFTVNSDTFGQYQLQVRDNNTPLWYGDYQGGKMAIHLAEIYPIDPTAIPCYGIIFVIAEQLDSNMNMAGCVLCDSRMSQATSVGQLLESIKGSMLRVAMEDKNSQVLHGKVSIH